MKKTIYPVAIIAVIFGALLFIQARPKDDAMPVPVSGQLVQGYRVVDISGTGQPVQLTVYRGDYLKFRLDPAIGKARLKIPALNIDQELDVASADVPFFKMQAIGAFPFSLGDVAGRIEVVAFQRANYAEVDSKGAAELLERSRPLLLDVRTPGEFQLGRLDGAVLIPVQQLQQRLKELEAYRDREILIYCATGNRSTVAAKILIDNGFRRVTNLRRGIVQWARDAFPVVR